MKKIISLLILVFLIVSCLESNEEILKKVSANLIKLKTIKYVSSLEALDNGQVVHKDTDTLSFDFTN